MTKPKGVGGIEPPKRPPSHVKVLKEEEIVEGAGFVAQERVEETTVEEAVELPPGLIVYEQPHQPRTCLWLVLAVVVAILILVGLFLLFWLNPTSVYVRSGNCVTHIVSYPWSTTGHIRCR